MSDLAIRTLPAIVAATSKRLGVDLPEPVTEGIAAATQLRTARRQEFVDAPNLATAVAAALWAGKDPLNSKDVQRAVLARGLDAANIGAQLEAYANQQAADAVLAHADAVIETWRPAVVQANEALQSFRKVAPGADLNDNNLATTLPSQALTPWGRAREAAALLDQLSKGWVAIATAGAAHVPHNGRPLIVADLSFAQLAELGTRPSAGDVARLDVQLDLANTTTYTERVARVTQDRAEAQNYEAQAPERAREERRRVMGMAMRIPAGT